MNTDLLGFEADLGARDLDLAVDVGALFLGLSRLRYGCMSRRAYEYVF